MPIIFDIFWVAVNRLRLYVCKVQCELDRVLARALEICELFPLEKVAQFRLKVFLILCLLREFATNNYSLGNGFSTV